MEKNSFKIGDAVLRKNCKWKSKNNNSCIGTIESIYPTHIYIKNVVSEKQLDCSFPTKCFHSKDKLQKVSFLYYKLKKRQKENKK